MRNSLLVLAFFAVLGVCFFGACNVRELLLPSEQQSYDEMLTAEAQAEAEVAKLEEAAEADPFNAALAVKLSEARAEFVALSAQIDAVEDAAIKERYGPIWGAVAGLPVVGPYFNLLGPLAGSFVLPLLSKRGRRHYKSAVRNVTPWVPDATGQKGVALSSAVLDVLRALGLLHSSDASAKAAATPAAA